MREEGVLCRYSCVSYEIHDHITVASVSVVVCTLDKETCVGGGGGGGGYSHCP